MHLPEQRSAGTDSAHDGEFTSALLAGRGNGSEQHHQSSGQGESKKKLNRPDDLVQHPLHLRQRAAHVHIGDVGKCPDQCVVETQWPGRTACRWADSEFRRAKGTDERNRDFGGQFIDWIHHKEIDMHRAPVDLAQAGDFCLAGLPGNVKAQAVAQLQTECRGQALLDTDGIFLARGPLASHDIVVRRLFRTVGQVELPVHQPLGTVFLECVGLDVLAIDGHQPTANHRVPVKLCHTSVLKRLFEGIALLGLYIDHKTVRRVYRRGIAPAADQVSAQKHQQHQRQQANGQGAGLHNRINWTGRQLTSG